jgi:hypothetical protein
MDVEVKGVGKRLFGGTPVPPGHVGIGLAFGARDRTTGERAEVVRLVKPAHEMLDFLTRLHSAVVSEMVETGRQVRELDVELLPKDVGDGA